VINCARGGHQVEPDIIAALDSGHLRGASLDVFNTEPLPDTSPLWSHPKIRISPHNAAMTDPASFMAHVANTILRMDKGLPPENLVDFNGADNGGTDLGAWSPKITFPSEGSYVLVMNVGGPGGLDANYLVVDVTSATGGGCATAPAGSAAGAGVLLLAGLATALRRRSA
jgi:hypothetical protein